ncbi:MAG TPA: S24/S26 family peptidase [Polyangia bacterium]|nr:S24/S26 family peptidase [Polyangia bacterium]
MELRASALRFVLAQGLPAAIEVSGGSMEPTIAKGAKVEVAALAGPEPLKVGDVVLVATGGDVLLVHRVMAELEEDGARFVVHQGDARASTFAVAARRDVLARVITHLPPAEPTLFRRRVLAVDVFLAARRLARAVGLGEGALGRRCARVYRRLARALSG